MNRYFYLLLLISGIISCKKEDPGSVNTNSFPGSLDSIYAYSDLMGDSANMNLVFVYRISYDDQRRVSRIDYDYLSYNEFIYDGNSDLPKKMVDVRPDRLAADPEIMSIDTFTYDYDSQKRMVKKNRKNYSKSYGITWPGFENTYSYTYGSNYMLPQSEGIFCDSDTVLLNLNGDPIRKNKFCFESNPYQEKVDEYYSYKNPFSTLNISPIKDDLYGFNNILWYPLDDVHYNLNEPKYLFKKISGYNFYYTNPMDRKKAISFYPVVSTSGRVDEFTVANITTHTDFNGDIFYSKIYSKFKFFYHP